MRWLSQWRSAAPLAAIALVAAPAAAGCGSAARSGGSSTSSTAEAATHSFPSGGGATGHADLATIPIVTGARSKGAVDARFTCAGSNISPPLLWGEVPASAREVMLLVRTLSRGSLQTNWVVAGISPKVHRLRAGSLPAGAVVGRNSFGKAAYSLCPPTGKPSLVVFAVLALPRALHLRADFDSAEVARLLGGPEVAWGSTTLGGGRAGAASAGRG